jgi:hypothetical protein
VSLLATAIVLAVLFAYVDAGAVAATLSRAAPAFVGFAVVAEIVNTIVCSLRYQAVQARVSATVVSLVESMKINWLTHFCAYLLPVNVAADGVRVVAATRRFGVPAVAALEGVVHDRALAAVGLALCLLLVTPLQAMLGVPDAAWIAQLTLAVLLLALWPCFGWLGRRSTIPAWAQNIVRILTRSPMHVSDARAAALQVVVAVTSSVCFALTLYGIARALALDLPFVAAIAFAPSLYLAQTIPFFYGGFGVRETAAIAVLAGSGALSAESAVSLSLAVGACSLLVALPGALVGADYAVDATLGRPDGDARRPDVPDA